MLLCYTRDPISTYLFGSFLVRGSADGELFRLGSTHGDAGPDSRWIAKNVSHTGTIPFSLAVYFPQELSREQLVTEKQENRSSL